MQVRVILNDEIVTSFKVCLLVSTFWGIDAIESSTEMNIFDKAVEQATEQFQENAKQIVEEVIESIPADYTELTEEVDKLNERLSYNTSVIEDITNEECVTMTGVDQSGKAIDDSGAIIDASDSWHVVTYNVLEGEAFRITASAIYAGRWYIFTDGTNIVGESGQAPTGGSTITDEFAIAPSRATKLIIGYNLSYNEGKVEKIVNNIVTGLNELDTRLDDIEALTEETSKTENVPMSDIVIHDNYYINENGGSIGPYTNWQYGEYTLPDEAETLVVTGKAGQAALLWQLQNANGIVLAFSQYDGLPTVRTETIPLSSYPTAVKVFVNDQKSGNLSIAYVHTQTSINGENVYLNGKDLSSVLSEGFTSDKLYGKILCCVGDSITYGADMDSDGITNESNITVYNCNDSGVFSQTMSGFRKTWGWQIASRHNMVFYNGGVSGSTMQGISEHSGFSLENGRYTKLPNNIDYLLIWFGWNDTAYGTLGTINDITNESYYGGYNVVLPYLINKYPYAKIGLIVPFGTDAGHRNAIRALGDKWGLAVWDNYQGGTPLYFGKEDSVGVEQSIVTANRAKFQANGAHPNYKGHRQLADMIEEWMKGI